MNLSDEQLAVLRAGGVLRLAACPTCDGTGGDYVCPRCGGSFSLPVGVTCGDHRPVRSCPACGGERWVLTEHPPGPCKACDLRALIREEQDRDG